MKLALTIFTAIFFSVTSAMAQTNRNVSQYNLAAGVGLGSYDPVAVFPEGGSAAKKGLDEFRVIHSGVTYLFANAENAKTFEANPEKYEPTYGGWCAYAMGKRTGSKVRIQPTLFTIHGNRAHYFVARSAKAEFDADIAGFEANADVNWTRISGESPRGQ